MMENNISIDWQEIENIISKYDGQSEALLMMMQDISDIYNYVPSEVIPVLVERLGVKESLIYGVATFYKTISLEPRGKYIVSVCTGTACHVRGAPKILEEFERNLNVEAGHTREDRKFSLDSVACLGCCAIGPVVVVDGEYHAQTSIRNASKIARMLEKKEKAND